MEWNFDFNAKDKASAKAALGDQVPASVAGAIEAAIDALPDVAGAAIRVHSNGSSPDAPKEGEDAKAPTGGAIVIGVTVVPLA